MSGLEVLFQLAWKLVNEQGRIRLLAVLASVFFVVLASRLFYIQILQGKYFYNLADNQYSAGDQYSLYERGSISFRMREGGELSAGDLDTGFILAINPTLLLDAHGTYQKLSVFVDGLDEDDFVTKASKKADPYEEIAHRLTLDIKDKIESIRIPGVILVREQWRDYPAGKLAAHTLGFVGYKGNELLGRYGVELAYDSLLTRAPGDLYRNFFSGLFEGLKNDIFGRESAMEGNIILSIEPRVQTLIESKLDELSEKWSAKNLGIMVLDPTTGEIVAMGAYPTFDPNNYRLESDSGVFSNPFVERVFEVGSIMKPISIAAALDSGVITPDTTYFDKGYIELDGKRIENFDGVGRGRVSMQEVLNQSLNTGATYAALALGSDKFQEYMYRFGFHDKTGVDLPNESGNLIENLESNRDVEVATASFGQGIAVTPISMVRALGALANGGFLIKPYVGRRVDYSLGYSEEVKVTEQGRAVSSDTSETITRMLVKVVDEHLANGKLKMDHYSIAAKTGTAQIVNPDGGGYYADRYMHSFFGYFPAYDPKFLVFLFMNEPKGVDYASQTLTDPFKDIAEFLISYYEIPPDR